MLLWYRGSQSVLHRPPLNGVLLGGLQGQSCLHNEIYMPLAYFTVLVFAWMVSKNWIYLTEAGILNSCPSKNDYQ